MPAAMATQRAAQRAAAQPAKPAAKSAAQSAQSAQMDATLRSASKDLRELARCTQQAAGAEGPEAGALLAKLEGLAGRLQQHRAAIRKWATQGGAAPAAQSKLAAARAQIEAETRGLPEALRALRAKAEAAAGAAAEAAYGGPSSPSSTAEGASNAEVKVLVEQMQACPRDGDVEAEFVCRICLAHLVGCGPKLTRCSHLFCGDCISRWFAAQPGNQTWAGRAQSAGVPCPVCKEPLCGEKDLHPVCGEGNSGSKMLWQLLSATKIVCANNARCSAEGTCDWVGDYASYQQHIAACENVPTCGACSDIAAVSEERASHGEEETEPREEKETANSDSEGTTCADAHALEDSEPEEAAPDSAEELPGFDQGAGEPAEAKEQSLSSLIQQLVELKAAQQLASPKAAAVVIEQAPRGPELELCAHGSEEEEEEVEEEFAAAPASPREAWGASSGLPPPPGVFVTRAQSKDGRATPEGERLAARLAQADAARAAWAAQTAQVSQAAHAAQAAQWQALHQWQAMQQARMAYAGQAAAQWQMAQAAQATQTAQAAQAAQMQAARAAWLAQAAPHY